MRKLILISSAALLVLACSNNEEGKQQAHKHDPVQTRSTDSSKKSIPSETKARVGNTDIKINYHAPAVRNRTIWGGLVPYDEVWVTGAHKATSLEINDDFKMGDKRVPAGKYALFTIPGKEEWTVILNKNWNQHLADDYSESEDVVRFKLKPEWKEEHTERLTYDIEKVGEKTIILVISWEKLRLPVWLEIATK